MREFDEHLFGVEVGDHLSEELGIEADVHGATFVLAGDGLVIDGGEIKGIGTHEELLDTCPIYKEIALSQLKEEEL